MTREHWSKIFLKQDPLEIITLKSSQQHQIDVITLPDGSRWICKKFAKRNWLGELSVSSLELSEELAARIAEMLKITFAAFQGEQGQRIQTIDDHLAILIPYCEGQLVTHPSESQAALLGRILAKIHSLQLPKTKAKPFPLIPLGKVPNWLKTIGDYCNRNSHSEIHNWVLSHRDIQNGNIIWRDDNSPHLIDWESAGLIHPGVELIGLAENCAGIAVGVFDIHRFRATLRGYYDYTKRLPLTETFFFELTLPSWLLWYVHCVDQHWFEEAEQTLQSIELICENRAEIENSYFDFFRDRHDESD